MTPAGQLYVRDHVPFCIWTHDLRTQAYLSAYPRERFYFQHGTSSIWLSSETAQQVWQSLEAELWDCYTGALLNNFTLENWTCLIDYQNVAQLSDADVFLVQEWSGLAQRSRRDVS